MNLRPIAQFHACWYMPQYAQPTSASTERTWLIPASYVASMSSTMLTAPHRLEEAKNYATTSETQAACYDRDHPRYPYKSHGQWLKACYGLVACVILIIFNGVPAFLTEPFDVRHFFASYIGVCSPTSIPTSFPSWFLNRTDFTLDTRLLLPRRWVQSATAWLPNLPLGSRAIQRPLQHRPSHKRQTQREVGVSREGDHGKQFYRTSSMGVGLDAMIVHFVF